MGGLITPWLDSWYDHVIIKPSKTNRSVCFANHIHAISLVVINCSVHFCKIPCLTQSYCSGICMRENDVYGSSAAFLYCHTHSRHCTDSDGRWHQDASGHTHRHSPPRPQHNASWLPEAVCHCSTGLRRPSRVNRYRTDCFRAHLSAHVYSSFIIRYMSVWRWHSHTDISECISKRKGKI